MFKDITDLNNESRVEEILNINTGGDVEWYDDVKVNHPYQATPYFNLNEVLKFINIDQNDTLVDFGCGKGRASFFFHYKTNCNTVGIEFDKELYNVCIENLNLYNSKFPSSNIKFLNMLAQEYTISKSDNIFYFFNPFSAVLFEQILNNISSSFFENPRDIKLILYYPQKDYLDCLQDNPFFELLFEIKLPEFEQDSDELILIYRFNSWE